MYMYSACSLAIFAHQTIARVLIVTEAVTFVPSVNVAMHVAVLVAVVCCSVRVAVADPKCRRDHSCSWICNQCCGCTVYCKHESNTIVTSVDSSYVINAVAVPCTVNKRVTL